MKSDFSKRSAAAFLSAAMFFTSVPVSAAPITTYHQETQTERTIPLTPKDAKTGQDIDVIAAKVKDNVITADTLKLPEGVTLVKNDPTFPVKATETSYTLQANTSNPLTTIQIAYTVDDKTVGQESLTRMLKGPEITVPADQLNPPKGLSLKNAAQKVSVKAGGTQNVKVPVTINKDAAVLLLDWQLNGKPFGSAKTIIEDKVSKEASVNAALLVEPGYKLKNEADETITIKAGTLSSRTLEVEQAAEQSTLQVLFTDEDGKDIGNTTLQVATPEGKPIEINLNESKDLKIPAGYELAKDSNPVKVQPGQTQSVTVVVKPVVEKTELRIYFVYDERRVGSCPMEVNAPDRGDGMVEFSQKDLKVPEGYRLKTEHLGTALEAPYGKSIERDIEVVKDGQKPDPGTPTDTKKVTFKILFQEKDKEPVPKVIELDADPTATLSEAELKKYLPKDSRLSGSFTSVTLKAGESKEITVAIEPETPSKPQEPTKPETPVEKAVFKITFVGLDGNKIDTKGASANPLEVTLEAKNGQKELTLTANDFEVPKGYKLKDPFKDVTISVNETKEITLTVIPDTMKEAIFKITYVDANGKTIESTPSFTNPQTVPVFGTEGVAKLPKEDLKYPDTYELQKTYTPFEGAYGQTTAVQITLEPKEVKAVFTITYKDRSGKVIGTETVEVEESTGANGIATLTTKLMKKVPKGYQVVETYKPVTTAYGTTLKVDVTIEPIVTEQKAQLTVVYYRKLNGKKITVETKDYYSPRAGTIGKEYTFYLNKDYSIKAPSGYTLASKSQTKSMKIKYGYTGTLEVEVTKNTPDTAAESHQGLYIGLMVVAAALIAYIVFRKFKPKKSDKTDA